MNQHKPIALIILDGFGYRETAQYNAIYQAKTPHWDEWWSKYPHTTLDGSGHAVGLPAGQIGNSEVGHLTIGAGRIVDQDLTRIDKAIEDGSFFKNPVFIQIISNAIASDKAVHIFGLLSPGGVHSHENHIHAFIRLAAQMGLKKLYIHAFLDGRDVPPRSAKDSLEKLEKLCQQLNCGKIISVVGRYYAMDRDNRWDRTQQAYNLVTQQKALFEAENAVQALENTYARNEDDEFVKATRIHTTQPIHIEDGDSIIFMNFRADRARQLTRAFIDKIFDHFQRDITPHLKYFATLTEYAANLPCLVAYPPIAVNNLLGEYISQQGLKQLRIAETEKYAHVTFFFNGGNETPYPNEDRILIHSPHVPTYDLQPQMSADELTEKLTTAILSKQYDLIVCNYANADMVGHSGNFEATVKAIETLDNCLGKVIAALQAVGGEAVITADHGNAECMYNDKTGQAHTAHTQDPVPFLYIGRPASIQHVNGNLADIAPTLLYLLGLKQPKEMTGKCLLSFK